MIEFSAAAKGSQAGRQRLPQPALPADRKIADNRRCVLRTVTLTAAHLGKHIGRMMQSAKKLMTMSRRASQLS